MDHAVMQSELEQLLCRGVPRLVGAASQLVHTGFAVSFGASLGADTLPDSRVEQLRIESSQSSV